jgi:hypothetical protein
MLGLPKRHESTVRLSNAALHLVLASHFEQRAHLKCTELGSRYGRTVVSSELGHLPGVPHFVARGFRNQPEQWLTGAVHAQLATKSRKRVDRRSLEVRHVGEQGAERGRGLDGPGGARLE